MEYCHDCGELIENCICLDQAQLEESLSDPETIPELNFDTGY